jgi:hypothetical protein
MTLRIVKIYRKIKEIIRRIREEPKVVVQKQYLPITKETIKLIPKQFMMDHGYLQGDLGEAKEKIRTYEDAVKVKRELDLEKILEDGLKQEAEKIKNFGRKQTLVPPVLIFSFPDDGEFIGYATNFYWYKKGFYIEFVNEEGERFMLGGESFDKVITFPRFFADHIRKGVLFVNYTKTGKFVELPFVMG